MAKAPGNRAGKLMNCLFAIVLSVVSGCILGFALPPNDLGYLAWFALAPLFAAASRFRWYAGFSLGLGLVMGLSGAFFSWMCSKKTPPVILIIASACAGVVIEFIGHWYFPANLGILLHNNIPLLQIASFAGVWGQDVQQVRAHSSEAGVKVAAVQSGSLSYLIEYTREAAEQEAQAVVWPELTVSRIDRKILDVSRDAGVMLIAGCMEPGLNSMPTTRLLLLTAADCLAMPAKSISTALNQGNTKRPKKSRYSSRRGFLQSA
jgi:apolipoprotein N-acyltransferase